ncbi:MAG: microtubule plus-end binding protein [Monoraphidium minutum]|nr:MAG: microtubule plus-end binding protein [Monoraphidium minutum]
MAGRTELLGWLNCTLDLRLGKVEETASGAVACQIMDALHPGAVPMKKVDFNAKNEYEYINNYKVLQEVFNKLGVDKHVEVSKLVKARPLDNMEFMQWLKTYFEQQAGGRGIADYDGGARRALCKTGDLRGGGSGGAAAVGGGGTHAPAGRAPAPNAGASCAGRITGSGGAAAPVAGGLAPASGAPAVTAAARKAPAAKVSAAGGGPTARAGSGAITGVRSRAVSDDGVAAQLQAEVATWRVAADTATKEKDFYWSKLRAIELLCNTCPDVQVLRVVEDILYAPSQEEGERILGEAMADLEAQGLAAPLLADDGAIADDGAATGGATAPADGAGEAQGGAVVQGGAVSLEGSAAALGAPEVGCSA